MITREDIDKHFADWQERGVMTSVKLDWESGTAEVVYDLHRMTDEANRVKQYMENKYPGRTVSRPEGEAMRARCVAIVERHVQFWRRARAIDPKSREAVLMEELAIELENVLIELRAQK